MRSTISDVGLEAVPQATIERLGPLVQATIEGAVRALAAIVDELLEDEQVFVLRSVRLSLFVQGLAREPAAMRAHLLAQLPRLVEVERALAERHGRAVS
jgi:hypothetical protein